MQEKRESIERHIVPFRGISKQQDYVNFMLSVSHDILDIINTSGGNSNIEGHEQINQNNLNSFLLGEKSLVNTTHTAGILKNVEETKEEYSDLSKWNIPSLTHGQIRQIEERDWELIPPETERGFFELEKIVEVQPGENLMIRFRPLDWNPDTVYEFGALNFDSSGDNMKRLEVDENNSYTQLKNIYFEHILRFDEERNVRLYIRTANNSNGELGGEPLKVEQFGIYKINEEEVYIKGIDSELKPNVEGEHRTLKYLEERMEERNAT